MNPYLSLIAGLAVGLTAGLVLAWWLAARARASLARERDAHLRELAVQRERLADQARADTDTRLSAERQAMKEAHERVRQDAEAAIARERVAVEDAAARLGKRETVNDSREAALTRRDATAVQREQQLERALTAAERRDGDLQVREQALTLREQETAKRDQESDARRQAAEARVAEIDSALQRIANLTPDQAKAEVLQRVDAELADEQAKRISRHEKDVTTRAKEMGIEIIARAIQRYAAEHTADTTSSKVAIKDDEMKGRLIGKEGRNIKAFEQVFGVDLIIDESPGFILVSCFSGLRREIARRAIEILLDDGRVHPGRIEEVQIKVQADIDREVLKLGEEAAFAVDVSGLHPQLLRLLGKLRWRTSYGQNVLIHTQEVAFLCGAMAADIGLDARLGRRCGLLHDIGKAIDHDQEGSHPVLGHEALKRYGESEIVANAALAHHEGHAVLSAYTVLAAAADAISAARPGARRENVDKYLKRLAQLEEIACSFTGVQKAYAIQAGRELRVIVNHHHLGDSQLAKVAHDIARRIEGEVTYPGEVRVTMIRETRANAVAR